VYYQRQYFNTGDVIWCLTYCLTVLRIRLLLRNSMKYVGLIGSSGLKYELFLLYCNSGLFSLRPMRRHTVTYAPNRGPGRAIVQVVSSRLPITVTWVRAQVNSYGICGGQSDTGEGYLEYFGFLCQFSFHRLLHIHRLSSGTGKIGQLVATVPSGLSLTPP
jgi:hypothetical protein